MGFTLTLPTEGAHWSSVFVIEGQPEPPRAQVPSMPLNPVSDGFFRTMGIPIVEGRGMGSADTPDAPRIAVVNQTFARRFLPAKSAIGHRFKQGWTLAGGAPWDRDRRRGARRQGLRPRASPAGSTSGVAAPRKLSDQS